MKIFDFDEQLKEGQKHEEFLDSIFAKYVIVQKVGMELQHKGIDRVFKIGDKQIHVEYKADRRATITGNAFIETISVSKTGHEGWAYTSQADWILYFLPQEMKVYTIPRKEMQKRLSDWNNTYRVGLAKNKDYYSQGILVPLAEIATFSKVLNI